MISKQEVKHIAKLARIGITKKEEEKFAKDLSSVLDYIEKLKEVDISRVKPTAHSMEMENVMRDDEESSKTELPLPKVEKKESSLTMEAKVKKRTSSSSPFKVQSSKLLEAMPETKDGYLKTKPIL